MTIWPLDINMVLHQSTGHWEAWLPGEAWTMEVFLGGEVQSSKWIILHLDQPVVAVQSQSDRVTGQLYLGLSPHKLQADAHHPGDPTG